MQKKIIQLTTQVGKKMRNKKLTLVTAESCTGGGLSYYLSLNPESSSILERGYVCYSNQAKENLLEVNLYTLQTHGPVSKKVAIEMAKGALKNSCAQVSIAITGIVGSDTKDPEKKGIVFICLSNNSTKPVIDKIYISGSRNKFCQTVIIKSLLKLITYLDEI